MAHFILQQIMQIKYIKGNKPLKNSELNILFL